MVAVLSGCVHPCSMSLNAYQEKMSSVILQVYECMFFWGINIPTNDRFWYNVKHLI